MSLGIDISKASFDVVLLGENVRRHKVFANTRTGFENLATWLGGLDAGAHPIGMEATGRYHVPLTEFLHACGYTVSVLNPARTKAYALSRMSRNKTDALLLAQYVQSERPPAWTPARPEVQALTALVHRPEELEAARQQECNRFETSTDPYVRRSLEAHVAYLDLEIHEVQARLAEHTRAHDELERQVALLTSIPGIGERTARKVLAEVRIEEFEHAKQVAAYAGLTPAQHVSGSSVRARSRLSKMGNASLRKALYFPAIAGMKWNPIIRAFCEQLRGRGKPKMVVPGAAMRKLLHLAFGVLKSGQPFRADFAATP